MNKNQTKGRALEINGKAKETAGKVTGNKTTQAKGAAEKTKGKVEKHFGDAKNEASKSDKR